MIASLLVGAAITHASTVAATAAQGSASWSIRPAGDEAREQIDHDVHPGERIDDAVWIDNTGTVPLLLDVYTADAFTTAAGGFDVRGDSEPTVAVGLWMRPQIGVVAVDPGERVEVAVRIDVPRDAEPGDHAGGVVAALAESVDALSPPARVGVRTYLRVDGELRPELSVDDVRVDYDAGFNPAVGDITVGYTVRNSGNVRLGADEYLAVVGPFDRTLRRPPGDPLPELLPGAAVRREITLENVPAVVRGRLDLSVDAVDTSSRLPVSVPQIDVERGVWMVPWSLAALAALIILVTVEWRRRRVRTDPTAPEAGPGGDMVDTYAGIGDADRAADAGALVAVAGSRAERPAGEVRPGHVRSSILNR